MSDNVVNFLAYRLNKQLKKINDQFIQDLTDKKVEELNEKTLRQQHNERVMKQAKVGKYKNG